MEEGRGCEGGEIHLIPYLAIAAVLLGTLDMV